ncbi:MAG: DNA alkylation repair protein [Sphingomonas sp.]|jgi:3-methyladenine DNA glycosylase AlkD|uniref:DNA alkylation repair protein n=1 Tax=Sphingomonas sp. TaxID=28214 RepID=UPI0035612A19
MAGAISDRATAVLQALEGAASVRVRDEMGPRFGIVTDKAMGVQMAAMQAIAKPLYPDHALAAALWETGWYEARMVACMVDDPALVTPEQMDAWRRDFDNWGIVDTVCAKLFDRVPYAFAKIDGWAGLNDEFGRRAAFALLACCAIHRRGGDADYRRGLALIEAHATDERNFVKKGVNWALRAIGLKGSSALQAAARETAARLAASADRTARWNGKDALRAFAKADGKSPTPPSPAKAGVQLGDA